MKPSAKNNEEENIHKMKALEQQNHDFNIILRSKDIQITSYKQIL